MGRIVAIAVTVGTAAVTAMSAGCSSPGDDGTPGDDRPSVASSPPSQISYEMIGMDPRIVLHDSDDLLDMAFRGTLRFDAASRCLYVETRDKKILPAWSRTLNPAMKPVLRDGKRGIDTGGHGVIMEGDSLIVGGSAAERRKPAPEAVPETCAPQATWIGTFGQVRPDR